MTASTTFKIDTYSCKVVLIITDNIKTELKKIYKTFKIPETITGEIEGAVVPAENAVYFILIDLEYLTHNTIAHEAFHVVTKITEAREVFDEESRAWLAGQIAENIYRFLHKKNIVVTHGRK